MPSIQITVETLRRNSTHRRDIAILQAFLANMGFLGWEIDGVFGPVTERAVKAYQARSGIDADGIVGPITWGKLSESDATCVECVKSCADADLSEAVSVIKEYEGLRLKAYLCPSGIPTIGWGSTRGVTLGMSITEEEAEDRLRIDLRDAAECVCKHVTVPLENNQICALVSFVFNVGSTQFASSTLVRLLNDGRYDQVPDELRRWIYGTVNGKKTILPGLVSRRKVEAELWSR